MADLQTVTLTNNHDGPRGFHAAEGVVTLEKGQTWTGKIAAAELKSALATGYFGDEAADEPGPLDQSVEKLTVYLEGVNDADEVEKLIAAEKGGKSRASAITALEARRDALLA